MKILARTHGFGDLWKVSASPLPTSAKLAQTSVGVWVTRNLVDAELSTEACSGTDERGSE